MTTSGRVRFSGMACLLVLLFAGCGARNGTTRNSGSPTGTSKPTAQPSSRTPIPGQVAVITDRTVYAPGDTVRATVSNGLTTAIYATPMHASCTILFLQVRNADGTWHNTNVAACSTVRAAVATPIAPSSSYTADIAAGRGGPVNLTPSPYNPSTSRSPFPSGTYRLVLYYSTTPSNLSDGEGGTMVASAPFQVR
jgi:hypothetical protein